MLTNVWADHDPGHDDALAIMMAVSHPSIHMLGISTVGGNQSLAKTTMNALKVLTVAGMADVVEVVPGQSKPLLRSAVVCPEIHGDSGLDGPKFPRVTARARTHVKAVTRMYEVFKENGRITLVATGPLTNVALLLILYPDVCQYIEKIVIMGGAIGVGNTSPAAEFNIEVDPEAAHVVFNSGVHVVMVPLEVTHTALVTPRVLARIRTIGTEFSELVCELLTFFTNSNKELFGFESPPLHDPCAVAYVIAPDLFQVEFMRVDVELGSSLCAGQTVCDIHGIRRDKLPKNVHVAVKMDVSGFFDLLLYTLRICNSRSPLNHRFRTNTTAPSKL